MLKTPSPQQTDHDMVTLEQLVAADHLLRRVDAATAADRAGHGKKPLPPKERQPQVRETTVSRTDPDAGYMVRDGKPKGFFNLGRRRVDGRFARITDTHVTPANVHDSIPYLARPDRQRARFASDVKAVGLDAGYADAPISRGWRRAISRAAPAIADPLRRNRPEHHEDRKGPLEDPISKPPDPPLSQRLIGNELSEFSRL